VQDPHFHAEIKMTQTRKTALAGLIGLVVAGIVSNGCSSSSSNSTGQGGSTGKGGSAGSTTGAGGSGTGTGGAAGATLGCAMSDPPPSATIADFSGADGGINTGGLMGGISVFGSPMSPTFSTATGALKVMLNATPGAMASYPGIVVYLNGNAAGTDCVDAHTYTGVQYDLSGSVTGCQVVYSTNDSEHGDSTTDPKKSSGPAGAYPLQLTLTTAQITTAVQTIKVPFTGTGAPTGGNPSTVAFDPSKVTGVQFQFPVLAATAGDGGSANCVVNLTIDNIAFY
jgi:hypothetical protein